MITLDWEKVDGLMPAIIQDYETLEILMLGYMNKEALMITQSSGFATFYSRSKKKLWTKGETSGNKLAIKKEMLRSIEKEDEVIEVYENDLDLIEMWEELEIKTININKFI